MAITAALECSPAPFDPSLFGEATDEEERETGGGRQTLNSAIDQVGLGLD